MKNLISGAIVAAALAAASGANAADIARPVYKAPPPVVVSWNWSGFYIGGHAGGAWSEFDSRWDPLPSTTSFGAETIVGSHNNSGFIGGVQAGFNWQAQNWVFGIEGDWSWTDLKKTVSGLWTIGNFTATDSLTTLSGEINWLASARGRLGFLATPQLLVYATGGAAWADVSGNASAIRTGNGYNAIASFSDTSAGWVIGGGLEWLATNNWMFRVEYLYYDFGSGTSIVASDRSNNFPNFPSGFTWNDATVQVVRGGISYKFDYSKAPVVAKY